MRSQEDPGIHPDNSKAVNDETQGNHKGQYGLIFVDVCKNQILSDKCWRDRETGYAQATKKKYKGEFWMLVRVTMKLIEVNAAFMLPE